MCTGRVDRLAAGTDFYTAQTSGYIGNLTILDAHGTTYKFQDGFNNSDDPNTSIPDSLEDRNGNLITFNNGTINETDTLGRPVLSSSGFGATGNTVTVSGLAQPYTLTWGTTPVTSWLGSTLKAQLGNAQCYSPILGPGGPISVVTAITLPNGQQYHFTYDPQSGLLSKITYPDGGYVSYTWAQNLNSEFAALSSPGGGNESCLYSYNTFVVSERDVSFDGQNVALRQNFTYSTTWNATDYTVWVTKQTTVTTTDVVRGTSFQTLYTYTPKDAPQVPLMPSHFAMQIPVEQTVVYKDTNGSTLRTVNKAWYDPYLLTSEQTTLDNGLSSLVTYQYTVPFGQIMEKHEYDFGQGSPTRKTINSYAGPIADRPCRTTVTDGGGTNIAETDYFYDGGTTVCGSPGTPSVTDVSGLPAGTHDETNYGPTSTTPRGNLTKKIQQCFPNCPNPQIVTTYTYDKTGQQLTMTDPNGNPPTQYSYADRYTSGTPPGNTNAYLTQITRPPTNGVSHITQFSYGYNDGQLTQITDENGQVSSFQYVDSLGRLTRTDSPDGGQTLLSYNDAYPPRVTTSKKLNASGQFVTSVAVMDGLGHVTQSQLTSDPSGTDYTTTSYDGLGRAYQVSNPYRTMGDPTYGLSTFTYDALGRTTLVAHPDGATVQTTYTGRATRVTDEGTTEPGGSKNLQRISQTDALGRLNSVCEVSSASQLGTSGTPGACSQDIAAAGFLTTYQYDLLGNLTSATQNGLNARTFVYNSLSQLTSASNPESGTITYTYDKNGNLTAKVAPKPNQTNPAVTVTTTYQYDALNRLNTKSYSDGTTPAASFAYDACPLAGCPTGVSLLYPIGRMVESYTSNTATFNSYDQMGRAKNQWQCTPQNCGTAYFPLAYLYDLNGDMTSATNGMGVTFSYNLDSAARITSMTSSLVDANHPATMLSSVVYSPFGGMSSATMGNGLNEALNYTKRGWLQSLAATGTSQSQGNPASATVSVSGSEQSSGGTRGTGSVTISGAEESTVINVCLGAASTKQSTSSALTNPCLRTVYDSGSVSITVNGVAISAGYGQTSTASSIASALTTSINGSSTYPVTASLSGTTITLTSKLTGSATNYSLSASTAYDTVDFATPSFTGSPSGATLTGGTGTPVFDSGIVTVTVNGFPESVAYGNGSTGSSIAAALVTAFNAAPASPVTATSAGSVVTLTSKAFGAGANYTLSASSQTNNPAQFSSPSFSASPSGSTLTGGTGGYNVTLSYAPNGDVLAANDSANGNWTYQYDDFNRLVKSVPSGQTYWYTYDYDRLGNRWHQSLNGTGGPPGNTSSLSFSGSNNRIDGYSYDAAGNLLNDGAHSYTYDAENRIVCVDSGTAIYVYDANGQRVRKTTGAASCTSTTSGTKVDYLYDLEGHQVSEVSAAGAWNRGEVYVGGRHLATYSGGASGATYFIHADWLGTERARSTVAGAVCETMTSLPFGDGLATSGSCGDPSPLHFTGKQHDAETNLDDFDARYYSSGLARFMIPDWAAKATAVPYAEFGDPQSLNLYSYVRNNPVTSVDADGHAPDVIFKDPELEEMFNTIAHESSSFRTELNAAKADHSIRVIVEQKGVVPLPNHAPADAEVKRYADGTTSVEIKLDLGDQKNAEHEMGHEKDARTNTDQFFEDTKKDARDKGGPNEKLHDLRPVEKRAEGFRKDVDKERKEFRKKEKEQQKQGQRKEIGQMASEKKKKED
jgi:RHS repeat-associated protein